VCLLRTGGADSVQTVRGLASAIVLWTLLATASSASAQTALAATSVDTSRLPPPARLTLRPEAGLELLSSKVARVLALRSDIAVELGTAPPPGLLEAVPVGNVALAHEGGNIRLVMGAAMGGSLEATLALTPDGDVDTRALALAIEALLDRAVESREQLELIDALSLQPMAAADSELLDADVSEAQLVWAPAPPLVLKAPLASGQRDDGIAGLRYESNDSPPRVKPMLFARVYGGASPESNALRTGVGGGGGLCASGHCLVLSVEYPLPIALEAGGRDVRYRYPTIACSFYSRPVRIGRFTPGIGVGLLSRIGHFERDMGIADYRPGLETDLGVRGTLEGAFEIVSAVDLVAEAGMDYALDRWQLGHGNSVTYRGPRISPWLQAGIRIRAE
jgi:hypothetical protein